MCNRSDFSSVNIGDKLWSIQLGECRVKGIGTGICPLFCQNNVGKWETYSFDGKLNKADHSPSLFFSKPEIIAPPAPKRMVKKTVVMWRNECDNGGYDIYPTREGADEAARKYIHYKRIACVRLTGEYEVEE